jgi:hypothetical protein
MYHTLEDRRVQCTSVMTVLSVGRYLELVEAVYAKRGGLDGQRAPLKTKTGLTIRARMVSDLQHGAVIPPVVLGVLADESQIAELAEIADSDAFAGWFSALDAEAISIIDGMQRTTALKEAVAANGEIAATSLRVEFWISKYLNSLIYRMLVLNTGQVPWELERQLETIYSQFLKRISAEINGEAEIFERDEKRRRVSAGQYQSSSIIELLLVFSSRKSEIDIKDRVAEDFARLDAIETTAHVEFLDYFIETLRLMVVLDKAFSKLPRQNGDEPAGRLQSGKDIFASFPAMAGFAAAVSVFLFDEPGFKIEWAEAPAKMEQVKKAVETVAARIDSLDADGLRQFMQMETLAERLSGRRGGVGRFEREMFRRAFTTLIKNAERLETMEPCWLAS